MPGEIRINFLNFWGLAPSQLRQAKLPGVSGGGFQDTLVRGAINSVSGVARRGPLLRDSLDMISPPLGNLTLTGIIPGVRIRSPRPDFTIAAGITGSAGAIVNVGGGAGIYFWNKRPRGEVGLYGSLSVGMITNIGASIGDQLCLMFGPAGTVLAGDSITIGVDIDIGVISIGGMLILSAPPVSLSWPPTFTSWPPPAIIGWTPEVIGIGMTLTAGISALPVSYTVMPGRTWIKPLTP